MEKLGKRQGKIIKLFAELGLEWSKRWSERWSELSKREQQIIILMLNNSKISRAELSNRIGINPSAIQKQIAKLKGKGIIKRIGPDRGGHWEIIDNKGV